MIIDERPVTASGRLPGFAWRPVGIVVAVQMAVLTALSGRYGLHRDELYFLAAGKRLSWSYVDQPPLTPLLARVATAFFGETPFGLRVASTLIGAASLVVVALVAREFGGGRGAQVFTAVGTALSTYVLVIVHMLSTGTADLLVWTLAGLLILRVLRTRNPRWWLAVGAVVGIGLLNKWLILLLVAAVGVSVLAVGPRRVLLSGWLFAGVAIALLIALPSFVWQAQHGWPQLTVAGGISDKNGVQDRVMFVPEQLLYLSPVLVPVWATGLARLWRDPDLRWARGIAVAYPVLAVVVLLLGGKPYYAIPMLLIPMAAGAESVMRRISWPWIAIGTVISLVLGLPLLPADRLGPVLAINKEQGEQVGWPGFADTVARAWNQIPAAQHRTAVIFAANYGEAGAVEHYGPVRGLPQPYSGHMSYWYWGPPPDSMTGPVLLIGKPAQRAFTHCVQLARNDNGIGIHNDEQGSPMSLCGLSAPWSKVWPSLRHYY